MKSDFIFSFTLFTLTLFNSQNLMAQDCVPLSSAPNVVRLDSCGKLQYSTYLNRSETNPAYKNRIPDFSFAGYRQGGVAIPIVSEKIRVPLMQGDATAAIQAAIDTVSARIPYNSAGHRGAVVLEKGTYYVSGTIRIRKSGVVLRGKGQDPDGTKIVATKRSQHTVISVRGSSPIVNESSTTRLREHYAGTGMTSLFVQDGSAYKVNDTIYVQRTPNMAWISALGMDQITSMPGAIPETANWDPAQYKTKQERKIVYRNGGHILIDIPLVDSILLAHGGGEIKKVDLSPRLTETGVEDLRIISVYANDTDEEHAWDAVELSNVQHSWIRRVTAENIGYAVANVRDSSFVTVEDSAGLHPVSQITGGRRYTFNVSGKGVGVLFQRVYSDSGRHSFVTGAQVTGPHVWVDSLVKNAKSDDGPHHRWGTGLLFDSTKSGKLNVQNRGPSGTGHGWAGGQILFWKAETDSFVLQAAPWSMNWAVGVTGSSKVGSDSSTRGPGKIFGADQAQPRSLYFQQLKDRLGEAAVNSVSNDSQLAGHAKSVIDLLTRKPASGSDPKCENGIKSGTACCPLACGKCGGSGCSGRPGGAAACCANVIGASGKSCLEGGAPCNIAPAPARAFETVIADPVCTRGIDGAEVCCAASCGTCGGNNCSSRPGGAAGCCTNVIKSSGKSCGSNEAPCVK